MSSVEIVLTGSFLMTVVLSIGFCWKHFKGYGASRQPVRAKGN